MPNIRELTPRDALTNAVFDLDQAVGDLSVVLESQKIPETTVKKLQRAVEQISKIATTLEELRPSIL